MAEGASVSSATMRSLDEQLGGIADDHVERLFASPAPSPSRRPNPNKISSPGLAAPAKIVSSALFDGKNLPEASRKKPPFAEKRGKGSGLLTRKDSSSEEEDDNEEEDEKTSKRVRKNSENSSTSSDSSSNDDASTSEDENLDSGLIQRVAKLSDAIQKNQKKGKNEPPAKPRGRKRQETAEGAPAKRARGNGAAAARKQTTTMGDTTRMLVDMGKVDSISCELAFTSVGTGQNSIESKLKLTLRTADELDTLPIQELVKESILLTSAVKEMSSVIQEMGIRQFRRVIQIVITSQFYTRNTGPRMPALVDAEKYASEALSLAQFVKEPAFTIQKLQKKCLVPFYVRLKSLQDIFNRISKNINSFCANEDTLQNVFVVPLELFGGPTAWGRFIGHIVDESFLSDAGKRTLTTRCYFRNQQERPNDVMIRSSLLMEIVCLVYGCYLTPGFENAGVGLPNCKDAKCKACSAYLKESFTVYVPMLNKMWDDSHKTVIVEEATAQSGAANSTAQPASSVDFKALL